MSMLLNNEPKHGIVLLTSALCVATKLASGFSDQVISGVQNYFNPIENGKIVEAASGVLTQSEPLVADLGNQTVTHLTAGADISQSIPDVIGDSMLSIPSTVGTGINTLGEGTLGWVGWNATKMGWNLLPTGVQYGAMAVGALVVIGGVRGIYRWVRGTTGVTVNNKVDVHVHLTKKQLEAAIQTPSATTQSVTTLELPMTPAVEGAFKALKEQMDTLQKRLDDIEALIKALAPSPSE